MFNLFKKQNKCNTCSEHNDLERLKQLQEYRASLSKELLAIEDPQKKCLYDIIRENHKYYPHWSITSTNRARQLGDTFADIVWHSLTGKYSTVNSILEAHFKCPRMVVEQIVNYLNGYLEWSRRKSEYYHEIGTTTIEINQIKERLGIQ